MNRIEIPLSKTKTLLGVAASFLFVTLGIFLLTKHAWAQPVFNPLLVQITGILCILFFGTTAVLGIRKWMERKIALIIDDAGIFENSHSTSAGWIPWADITGIRIGQVATTRFILIDVKNPDKYLAESSGFKRKILKANMNLYNTPLAITATTLDTNFDKLVQLLNAYFDATH